MTYPSVDALQKTLASEVFLHTADKKKAAGRALGTIVELITFYLLREWNLIEHLSIERHIPEFANGTITHNVEFGLHPLYALHQFNLPGNKLPLSSSRIKASCPSVAHILREYPESPTRQLLSSNLVQRNACVLGAAKDRLAIANIVGESNEEILLKGRDRVFECLLSELRAQPIAIVECKRVGIEEGARKGPTTIEKAKQGAYVAKHVSALQKVRAYDGTQFGVMAKPDGSFEIRPWADELRRLIYDAPTSDLDGFVMTVGVASNHGNWFTTGDPNKELRVLAQSYDWLLFLTDYGVAEFVGNLLLDRARDPNPVRAAFLRSYGDRVQENVFTKVKILRDANVILIDFFNRNLARIENDWFRVLSPKGENMRTLKDEIHTLLRRDWK